MASERNSHIFAADVTDYSVTAFNATGLYENTEGHAWVHVSTNLSLASEADGIVLSYSENGLTESFREVLSYLTADATQFDTVPCHGRYMRLSLLTDAAGTLSGTIAVRYSDSHPEIWPLRQPLQLFLPKRQAWTAIWSG